MWVCFWVWMDIQNRRRVRAPTRECVRDERKRNRNETKISIDDASSNRVDDVRRDRCVV